MSLAKLEDYVVLTNRNSQINYIVERDGRIWKSPEFPEPYFVTSRQQPVVLNWQEHISPSAIWRWRKQYLPVLEISDDCNTIELIAVDDELFIRKNSTNVFTASDQQDIPVEKFACAVEGIEKYWGKFFAAGWQPPDDEVFPKYAWRACIVQALNAFCGLHPKYGTGYYSRNYHDAFPPTIISMADMLLDYHHCDMAMSMLEYYFNRFVMPDGSIDYYGPALSEYGMILDLAGKIANVPTGSDWLKDYFEVFLRMARYLYRLRNRFISGKENKYRLLTGVPEADIRDSDAIYTQNNAWVWHGLNTLAKVAKKLGFVEAATEASREANDIKKMLTLAILENPMTDGLVPFRLDNLTGIESYTDSRDSAYANFRYYPELLASGFLSEKSAMQIIKAREKQNGELNGLTYFHFDTAFPGLGTAPFCCNNLQIAAYAQGLMHLNQYERFMRTLSSHFLYHQTQDTFTAYENVDAAVANIRRGFTDWCVPCQLAYPRILRWGYQKFGKVEMLQ